MLLLLSMSLLLLLLVVVLLPLPDDCCAFRFAARLSFAFIPSDVRTAAASSAPSVAGAMVVILGAPETPNVFVGNSCSHSLLTYTGI